MRILWLCNVIIPQAAAMLDMKTGVGGGWLNQLSDIFDKREDIDLCVMAPYQNENGLTHITFGNGSRFYGFKKAVPEPWKYDESLEKVFKRIINEFNPDIVHIFGTEFPHSLAMVRAFNNPKRTIIHIQGLVSAIAKHYEAFLPYDTVKKYSFRDFIKRDNIANQREKFKKRGIYEKEAIKKVNHVFYRTDWDRAVTKAINPKVKLHYAQEMMRERFYTGEWRYEECEKYSIFISQGGYPVKGLHIMLEALGQIKRAYKDVKLYIAGEDMLKEESFKDRIRKSCYAKYLKELITERELFKNVMFTGFLDEEAMKCRYLKSNVFVSASSIENSPNSVAEAMLLGVPSVVSFVGGCSSLITHGESGFLYQADAPYMLAEYVCRIFESAELAEKLSFKEKERAKEFYNREKIVDDILKAYGEMINL